MTSNDIEKRSELRTEIDQYYSVEFSVPGATFAYQFKIWNLSSKGLCVAVKNDSDLLKHLNVGAVLNMKYYSTDSSNPMVHLKTEVKHITKNEQGQFKGHTLVGLSILENQSSDQKEAETN